MNDFVGFSRSIKLSWLNKITELQKQGLSETEIKEQINFYLSFEIKSPIVLRKTREILLDIWVRCPNELTKLRNDFLETITTSNNVEAHWCMIALTYPLFVDVANSIGRISQLQDTFKLSWLKSRIFEKYGERGTIYHSLDKIISTLRYLGVIEAVKRGEYKVIKKSIYDKSIITNIAIASLYIESESSLDLNRLNDRRYMFPFTYLVTQDILDRNSNITMDYLGGKKIYSLKNVSKSNVELSK